MLLINLGWPGTDNFDNECSLCTLFLFSSTKHDKRYALALVVLDAVVWGNRYWRLKPKPGPIAEWLSSIIGRDEKDGKSVGRFLAVLSNWLLSLNRLNEGDIGKQGIILPLIPGANHHAFPHRVEPSQVPYEIISSWTLRCQISHVSRHYKLGMDCTVSVNMLLLDCLNGNLIMRQDQKYVALNYIWGILQTPLQAGLRVSKNILAQLKIYFDYLRRSESGRQPRTSLSLG